MKSKSVLPKTFIIILYFSEALEKAKNEIEGDIEENKEAIEELKKWQTEIKKDKETICEVFSKLRYNKRNQFPGKSYF